MLTSLHLLITLFLLLPPLAQPHHAPIRQYRLDITHADSLTLYTRDVWSKEYLGPGRFEYDGEVFHDVHFRFRGHCYGRGGCNGTRPNKSFKIKFPKRHKLDGTIRNLNLNVIWHYTDRQGGIYRSKLPMDTFARAGYPSPRIRWCEFYLNGRYMGLFLEQQELDSGPFLSDWFADPSGNLYRFDKVTVDSLGHTRFWREINVEDDVDWSDFLRLMLTVEVRNPDQFWHDISTIVDIPMFLDHAALNMLCSVGDLYNYGHRQSWDPLRTHEVLENPAIYHDPNSDRFVVLPWDANAALFEVDMNVLPDAWGKAHILGYIITNPEWRELYKARLRHHLNTVFVEDRMFEVIDGIHAETAEAMVRHNERWQSEYGRYDVDKEREKMKEFILARRRFVVESLCSEDGCNLGCRLLPTTPNPFYESTAIRYLVGSTCTVRMDVFDVSGRRVRRLVQGMQVPGAYQARWDGRNEVGERLATGVYYCRLVGSGCGGDAIKVMYLRP